MKTKEIFSSNLRVTKTRLNWSRGQMAIRLGKKQKTIDAYFEGRSMPPLQEYPHFCEVLKIEDPIGFLKEMIA